MSGAEMKTNQLTQTDKFRGALLGGMIGDCLGEPFEKLRNRPQNRKAPDAFRVNKFFRDIFARNSGSAQIFPYTDDTEMARCTAASLLACQGFDAKDLAKRFTAAFFNRKPPRNYGPGVRKIFYKFKCEGFSDPFGPAKTVFDGQGSMGNGAAMRVAPAALYAHRKSPGDIAYLKALIRDTSSITHANKWGIRGAMLLGYAIVLAIEQDPEEDFKQLEFLGQLIDFMKEVETSDSSKDPHDLSNSYVRKLIVAKRLLYPGSQVTVGDIQKQLGNFTTAPGSVVSAIFCALVAQDVATFRDIESNCKFRRGIQIAISLGGDTDTISCMTGYILGAHLGASQISKDLVEVCEDHEAIGNLGYDLYHDVLGSSEDISPDMA